MIYLDYMSTTPIDPRVIKAMLAYMGPESCFANPASINHQAGQEANKAVAKARSQVASLINADKNEIIWTSGATEADNLAIKGAARFYQSKGKHIITSQIEHKAVLDTCEVLAKEGFEITYLKPNQFGIIELEQIKKAIRTGTILISLMHVNNEIGSINYIDSVAKLAKEHKILFHIDAAQSAGKIDIDVEKTPVDLISLASHKLYGPKGIGALYVRQKPKVRLQAQIHGGGHEQGLRSGTLATHQIVGMGEAFSIAKKEQVKDYEHVNNLRNLFLSKIKQLNKISINGPQDSNQGYPGTVNICFHWVDGEALLLDLKNIAVSTGSACNTATTAPSYVLQGIGLTDLQAHGSLRFSFGRFSTEEEIEQAAEQVIHSVNRLRALSPLWEQHQND